MASPAAAAVVTTKSLTGLDIGIIAVYFVIIFGIGVYFARKGRSSVDYFLAGRNVGWFAIGASLFVSNISTEHFIGLAGSGATSGLAVGHFEWLACLILLILGWVFVPFYLRSNVFTMPEFLERRFNRASSVYLASISISHTSSRRFPCTCMRRRSCWSAWSAGIRSRPRSRWL